ncbi:Mechanosensitive ion channel-domain-containing protein [Sparassis latifolia]
MSGQPSPRQAEYRDIKSPPPFEDLQTASYPLLPSHSQHPVRIHDYGRSSPPSKSNAKQKVTVSQSDSDTGLSSALRQYDEEQARGHGHHPYQGTSHGAGEGADYHHPARGHSGSWDILSGIKKLEHSYVEFDSRHASQAHLAFAEGDVPNNGFSKLYNYLLNASIVTRWIVFIIPVLGLLWIPGILGLTKYPHATIWGVKLMWWSIWLTIVWCGWWGSLAAAMLLPHVARHTVGVVVVGARRYIEWLYALKRYVALFVWTLAVWISFQPLVNTRQESTATSGDVRIIDTVAKLLFAFYVCAGVLLFEKFAIQWIAGKFHERSYAERIADQKFAVRVLVTLYRHSSDIPWRSDTLRDGPTDKRASMHPKKFIKKALKGVRFAATTTTTALGNVASEIAGSSVLQPNSPQAMVQTALESANKSRLLARRLYYSFVRPGAHELLVEDIARFFRSPDEADAAFAIFDKDMNGDATRDELEMACMDCHREQLSLEHSMHDLDSAVGRLDNILMSVYVIVVIVVIAVALEAQLATLITGAGTMILGLSWLIGSSVVEVLTSIIFLFLKHPFDVGDRVTIQTKTYTVKEIRLLSTVFLDGNSCQVQAPNSILNTYFIENMRRSPQMSEPFEFDVAYSTTFEQIEHLRELMIEFLKVDRRNFLPSFDVVVVDMPGQELMTLKADIKYKSNWQQAALQAQRRNKWICALKTAMKQAKVFGPKGNPDATPAPERYTEVPWEDVAREDRKKESIHQPVGRLQESRVPTANWAFSDKNAVMLDDSQDIFDESEEVSIVIAFVLEL